MAIWIVEETYHIAYEGGDSVILGAFTTKKKAVSAIKKLIKKHGQEFPGVQSVYELWIDKWKDSYQILLYQLKPDPKEPLELEFYHD